MNPPKSTFAPEPNRWQRPLILRDTRRLAMRTYGMLLAGYTFYSFPEETIPHPALRFIAGLMGACAPLATMLVLAASSTSVHRDALADRLYAETPGSTRVSLIFCKKDQRFSVDEGILTFESGALHYLGVMTTFRLGRSQVDRVYGVSDNRQELMFLDEGEPHRIAFEEKGKNRGDLPEVFRLWMERAPADATFEPPPYVPPPSPVLSLLKGLVPWVVGFALGRAQLHLLPPNSREILSFVFTFLFLWGLVAGITLIQASIVGKRVARDPLSTLLNHPRPSELPTTCPFVNRPDDVPSHQNVVP